MLQPNDRILFQGDSITDAGRDRTVTGANQLHGLGRGYALMAGATLLADAPDAGYEVLNRGVSGDRVLELTERWQADCLALEPTVVSLLVGVNDTGHAALTDSERHVPLPAYEKAYRDLLEALPAHVRLVLGEPFAIKAGPVTDGWIADVRKRAALVREIAREYDAVLVPYQQMFDDALKLAGPEHWMPDGFHPSPAGHMLMARTWLACVQVATPAGAS